MLNRRIHSFVLVVALALIAAPNALAKLDEPTDARASPTNARASASCKAERKAMGKKSFRATYGRSAPMKRCIRQTQRTASLFSSASRLSVSLTKPLAGATGTGTVTLDVKASSTAKLVRYFVDDVEAARDSSGPNFSQAWYSTTAGEGTHRLYAKASDSGGRTADSQTITITVDNIPDLTVSLSSPTGGSVLKGTVTLNASTSSDVQVVRYYLDGVEVASDSSPSDFSEPWDTTTASNGAHVMTAKAWDSHGQVAQSPSVDVTVDNGSTPTTSPTPTTPAPSPSSIIWSADHETGSMSQWPGATLNWDSGLCTYHGVSRDHARSGLYSMKLTLDTSAGKAGCRQARNQEIQSGGTYYYSAWYYLPKSVTAIGGHWNTFQFKSKEPTGVRSSDPMWTIDFAGSTPRPRLSWKGGEYGLAGPQATDGVAAKYYGQTLTTVPVGRWTHLEVYLKQSSEFNGHITVWHDGQLLWDIPNVRTKHAGDGRPYWSVNNYAANLSTNPYPMYIDDATISTGRLGTG